MKKKRFIYGKISLITMKKRGGLSTIVILIFILLFIFLVYLAVIGVLKNVIK